MKKMLVVLVGMMCLMATPSYANKKNIAKSLIKAATSKAPSAAGKHIARQTVRKSLGRPLSKQAVSHAANTRTAKASLLLERLVNNALHPQTDISNLVPIQPAEHFDFTNAALLRVQESIQNTGGIPKYYSSSGATDNKVVMLGFYDLLLKDIKGKLSPEEQTQLRYLFWHTNTSVPSVERKLQSWQDKHGYTPTLPDEEIIPLLNRGNMWPLEWVQKGWALAADVYMLQKLYGANLPKRIKNAQVLPLEELKQIEAKDSFQQQLKKEQEWIENARASGLFDTYWSKVEIADVVYKDTDKLARMVKAFYFYYIDPQLKVFPRAKYLKTNEAGRIYEIPLKRGLFLKVPGPLNLIPITPGEYVVFAADGENPHLVKRANVELLTDPAFYELTK